jgi:hypothetical protein
MSLKWTGQRVVRRMLTLVTLGVIVSSVGARPPATGISYKIRFMMAMPSMPGMPPMGDIVIVGHGVAIGSHSRLDIDSMQGGSQQQSPFGPGDYLLALDSGRVLAVSPATKTYVDGFSMSGGALPANVMAMASISDVAVNVQSLGAGDTTEGRPTTRYKLTSQYVMQVMGTAVNMSNESDILTAQLPVTLNMPLSGSLPKSMATGPFADLFTKMSDAQKQISGAPIRVNTNINIAGPMTMSMTQSWQLTDVRPVDVDEKALQIPEGYTVKPPSP